MKILITGSRSWTLTQPIVQALHQYPRDTRIIHGGARGADELAGSVARGLGFQVEVYPADWQQYGKRAGYIRNNLMLDQEPDLVLAFWDGKSPGTAHTIKEAEKRGIPVEVIRDPGAAA